MVVAGRDSTECGCVIAPGDSLRLGYYAAVPGSHVRVRDAAGAAGRFHLDPARVDSATGAVVIRVTDASLAPAGGGARRAAAPGGPAARSAQGISARPLMTLADRNAVTPPPPPAGPGVSRVAVFLLVLLIAAAGAGVYLLLRPRLEFTNTLAAPVRLVVGDAAPRTVAPGATIRLPIARGRTLVAQWELVRPMSANATPMGEEMRGSTVLREPSGTVRATAGSRTADGAYFAPLVTNAGSQALRVTVNAGLQGAVDCGCAVRPGARRVFIGYYRLYRNSTVSAWVRAAWAGRPSAISGRR